MVFLVQDSDSQFVRFDIKKPLYGSRAIVSNHSRNTKKKTELVCSDRQAQLNSFKYRFQPISRSDPPWRVFLHYLNRISTFYQMVAFPPNKRMLTINSCVGFGSR